MNPFSILKQFDLWWAWQRAFLEGKSPLTYLYELWILGQLAVPMNVLYGASSYSGAKTNDRMFRERWGLVDPGINSSLAQIAEVESMADPSSPNRLHCNADTGQSTP